RHSNRLQGEHGRALAAAVGADEERERPQGQRGLAQDLEVRELDLLDHGAPRFDYGTRGRIDLGGTTEDGPKRQPPADRRALTGRGASSTVPSCRPSSCSMSARLGARSALSTT